MADSDRPKVPPKKREPGPWNDEPGTTEEPLDFSELENLLTDETTGPINVGVEDGTRPGIMAPDATAEWDDDGKTMATSVEEVEIEDKPALERHRKPTPPPPLPPTVEAEPEPTPAPSPRARAEALRAKRGSRPVAVPQPEPDQETEHDVGHAHAHTPTHAEDSADTMHGTAPPAHAAAHEPEPEPPAAVEEDLEPPPGAERTPLNDKNMFRAESQKLARARDWQGLAGLTSAVLAERSWARAPETRAALYADLGRIYRDRLKDLPSAEDAYKQLSLVEPANADALHFLGDRYEQNKDWRALYDLYGAAVEATWDETQRLEWTRKTAELGQRELGSTDLAIEAWERLFRLGDAVDETSRALSEHYRRAGRWDRLAEFLARRAEGQEGVRRVVSLREIAEAYLSGMRDHDKAATVLDEILQSRGQDIIALIAMARVMARRKSWEELSRLVDRAKNVSPAALLDLRRVVADALRAAEEHERAIIVYEQILAADPRDGEALTAKQDYLSKTGRIEELVAFLARRAEQVENEAERGELLEQAARVAEKQMNQPALAVQLWEKRAELATGKLEAFGALAALYDSLGDNHGLRRALEGQLALTRLQSGRIEILRHLGEHCAHRMSDDARAESCWREILASVPDDQQTQNELVALYRRRGDFEALDRTFSTHAWRPLDEATLTNLWRQAALNVQENLSDVERAVRSWLRVTDLRADDAEALAALVAHHRALGRKRELIAALEAQLRADAASAPHERIERALEIGGLWEQEGDTQAALAAYERVLRYAPANDAALAGVSRLQKADAGVVQGALDVALTTVEGGERAALLEAQLPLVGKDDKIGRVFALRRLLRQSGEPKRVEELTRAAEDAGAFAELEAVYLDLAASAEDEGARRRWHERLASVYEHKLKDPVRAFLVLANARQLPVAALDELEPLFKLAAATGRHEDHLALLDVAARAGAEVQVRKEALRRRMTVCERDLKNEERAFYECLRLLNLDPHDARALDDARRLAAARGLWRQLDALYAELWLHAGDTAARLTIARARHQIRGTELKDAAGALDQLLVSYRLEPTAEVEQQLLAVAERDNAWHKVLPLIDARVRASETPESAAELERLAGLFADKRKENVRAFELYAEAFVRRPGSTELEAKLEALAEATQRWDVLGQFLREAAVRAGDPARMLHLYRKVADIYVQRQKRPDLALDVHRRILNLDPRQLPSLEVVIAHQRESQLWRELRDSLQQWMELAAGAAAPQAERVTRWLEIARISVKELGDAETALATYAQVLDVDAGNAEALAGIRSLTEGVGDAQLEVRRLRIELDRSTGPRRAEILLRSAQLQETELDDPEAAGASLRRLIEEAGHDGPGYAPLAALYEKHKRWGELVDLIEARAAHANTAAATAISNLERAAALCDAHPEVGGERRERVYRRLLEKHPDDATTRRRLLALYRGASRHQDLAQLLEDTLRQPALHADERRLVEDELVRLMHRSLGRTADGAKVLEERAKRDAQDQETRETLLGLATLALDGGDLERYCKLRADESKLVAPSLGALILCHLAEVRDERGQGNTSDQSKILEYYRAARALDPANQPAMEALKAVGRRTKNWRAGAALLNDDDERGLAWPVRAQRLCERGDACAADDPAVATSWYERAIATDANQYAAWDGLARLAERGHQLEEALTARRAALAAFERGTAPEPERLHEHAQRIEAVAAALRAAPDEAGERAALAARLSLRAYDLVPALAPAALAVADQRLADGVLDEAYSIYDRVLGNVELLTPKEKLHAYYQRGGLAARTKRLDQAIADLREGLRIETLHSGLLNLLAQVLAEKGRIPAAIQHYIQALLLASDEGLRGQLYARLGRLWEDRLGQHDEAGVCYDLAIAAGVGETDLMVRALGHYRRSGQHARALEVIESLLPVTQKPAELAQLWAERGHILMSSPGGDGDEGQTGAMEAFDMALSYDPACSTAVSGLATLLERRGDWKQLVELLEVRAESGAPAERAEAMRHLARVAVGHLKDRGRAEKFLQSAIELDAKREDFEQLIEIYGDDPRSDDRKKEALSGLLEMGGPYMPRLIELGRSLYSDGRRRWAWCVLSPLMNSTMPDPQLKAIVLELRKEFEKAENTAALTPETHNMVRHRDLPAALYEVLAELDGKVALGPAAPEQIGAAQIAKLDARTATGKTFLAIAEKLGLEGAVLGRAQDLSAPYRVLDSDVPFIVARSNLFQLLSPAETNCLFATMLEQARPGARVVSALGNDGATLIPALLHAVFGTEVGDEDRLFAEAIKMSVDAAQLGAWGEKLQPWRELSHDAARLLGQRVQHAVAETARRVGLVAAADLRFAAKLLTRLDDTLHKLPTAGKLEDLDDFFAAVPPARGLAGFAVSPRFGRALEI